MVVTNSVGASARTSCGHRGGMRKCKQHMMHYVQLRLGQHRAGSGRMPAAGLKALLGGADAGTLATWLLWWLTN